VNDNIAPPQSQTYCAEITAELEDELRQLAELEAALQKIAEILGEDHA
jgi:hypothetical protein